MTTEEHAFMRELRTLLREWDISINEYREDATWVFEDSAGTIQIDIDTIQEEITP